MSSTKRPPDNKRAVPPRSADYTRSFIRDWQRLNQSGRFDMRALKTVMLSIIANDAPLGPEFRDHPLKGEWSDHRECHIGGDFLLIYRIGGDEVVFARAGTHAELFE